MYNYWVWYEGLGFKFQLIVRIVYVPGTGTQIDQNYLNDFIIGFFEDQRIKAEARGGKNGNDDVNSGTFGSSNHRVLKTNELATSLLLETFRATCGGWQDLFMNKKYRTLYKFFALVCTFILQ